VCSAITADINKAGLVTSLIGGKFRHKRAVAEEVEYQGEIFGVTIDEYVAFGMFDGLMPTADQRLEKSPFVLTKRRTEGGELLATLGGTLDLQLSRY